MHKTWDSIDEVRTEAIVCCRCPLCYTRTYVVFGEGPAPARLMIIGEGPGAEEDKEARPFVGRAGRLLDELLSAAGIQRSETWITNIVRCRPVIKIDNGLRNRPPRATEIQACEIWMEQEYRFVSPHVVVCLGAVPAQALIFRDFKVKEHRGKWHEGRNGIPTIGTYHPAYVLRLRGDDRASVERELVADLTMAKSLLQM